MRGSVIGVLAVLAVAAGPPSRVELRRGKLAGAVSTTESVFCPPGGHASDASGHAGAAGFPQRVLERRLRDRASRSEERRRDRDARPECARVDPDNRGTTWREGGLVLMLDLADAALRLPQPNPRAASQLIALGYDEITRKPDKDTGDQALDRAFEHRWHEAAVGILEGAHDGKQILE